MDLPTLCCDYEFGAWFDSAVEIVAEVLVGRFLVEAAFVGPRIAASVAAVREAKTAPELPARSPSDYERAAAALAGRGAKKIPVPCLSARHEQYASAVPRIASTLGGSLRGKWRVTWVVMGIAIPLSGRFKYDHEDFDTGDLHEGCHGRRYWMVFAQLRKGYFRISWTTGTKCLGSPDKRIPYAEREDRPQRGFYHNLTNAIDSGA